MIDENLVITVTPNVDYKNLSAQPSPEDWFLVSRVTGEVTVRDLCNSSGLGRDKTLQMVDRLLDLGLLQVVGGGTGTQAPSPAARPAAARPEPAVARPEPAARPVSRPSPEPEPKTATFDGSMFDDEDDDDDLFMPGSPAHAAALASARSSKPAPVSDRHHGERATTSPSRPAPQVQAEPSAPPPSQPMTESSPSRPDQPASDDGPFPRFPSSFGEWQTPDDFAVPGIDEELLREISFVHAHLDQVDFYQLFGVDSDADRRSIKKTYFSFSKKFHPDKFFRGEHPELAKRVEDIFKFVTRGWETLSNQSKREEYDRALAELRREEEVASREEERKRNMAADMLARRGQQLEQQGDLAGAAEEYRKVATLRRDPAALVKAAELLLRSNQRLDEAAQLARAACSEIDDVSPRLVLGQIYEKNGMLVEALDAFEEAAELEPGNAAVKVHVERVRSQLR